MKKILQPLKRNEATILKLRGEGLSFCQLDESDQQLAIDEIIFTACNGCGADVPHGEMFLKYLLREVANMILVRFKELTLAEIIGAIRLNTGGGVIPNIYGEDLDRIKFSGTFIHVDYLARVLSNYKILRDNVDSRFRYELSVKEDRRG